MMLFMFWHMTGGILKPAPTPLLMDATGYAAFTLSPIDFSLWKAGRVSIFNHAAITTW